MLKNILNLSLNVKTLASNIDNILFLNQNISKDFNYRLNYLLKKTLGQISTKDQSWYFNHGPKSLKKFWV